MPTHGLWIIICCKHHGEIICFVSKQAPAILLCVKALRSVHSGYLGHLRGEGEILHDLRREHVTLCSKVFQETLSHCSLVSRDSCQLRVFVICQLSLSCSFVRSAECPALSVYCLQQYAACSNNTSLDLSPGLHRAICSTAARNSNGISELTL